MITCRYVSIQVYFMNILFYRLAHVERRWYISRNHKRCPNDAGWLVVVNDFVAGGLHLCPWDRHQTPKPIFLYSLGDNAAIWEAGTIVTR